MKRFVLSVLMMSLAVAMLAGCENRADLAHKQLTVEKIRAELVNRQITYMDDDFVIEKPAYVKLLNIVSDGQKATAKVDIKALELSSKTGISGQLELVYAYDSGDWQLQEIEVSGWQELNKKYVERELELVDFPLHFAANIGDIALVKKALRDRVAVNEPEKVKKSTALMFASERGELDIVKLLLAYGAEVNYANRNGLTALHAGSYGNHLEVVKLLLEHDADINASDRKGKTALSYAASRDAIDVASYLVKQGVDVNSSSKEGRPAIFTAAKSNAVKVAKLLIAEGAEVNFTAEGKSFSPLLSAAYYNSVEMVDLLLEAGAETSAPLSGFHRGSKIYSARELAEKRGYEKVLELLEKKEQQEQLQ